MACAFAVLGACFLMAVTLSLDPAAASPHVGGGHSLSPKMRAPSESRASARPSAANPSTGSSTDGVSDGKKETTDDDASGDQWRIALVSGIVGALIGAFFTLLGERIYASHLERKTLKNLLTYLSVEISEIRRAAEVRSERSAADAFPFDPPLTTSAWTVVRESEVAWRLIADDNKFLVLSALFTSVDDANHRREVAAQMYVLALTGATGENESRHLQQSARSLVTDPYREVLIRADAALQVLPTKEPS